MDATIALIITAAATILATTVPQVIQLVRARSDQAHELKRDQRAKQYEFYLLEYKERRDACADLLIATRFSLIQARSEYIAHMASSQPPADATYARPLNTVDAAAQNGALGSEAVVRGMRILLTDKDAEQVVKLYSAVPTTKPSDDPYSDEAMQAWSDSVSRLQDAVDAYLDGLRRKLFSDETKAAG